MLRVSLLVGGADLLFFQSGRRCPWEYDHSMAMAVVGASLLLLAPVVAVRVFFLWLSGVRLLGDLCVDWKIE